MFNKLIAAVDGKETARTAKMAGSKRNSIKDDLLDDLNKIGATYAKSPPKKVQEIPLPKAVINDTDKQNLWDQITKSGPQEEAGKREPP